MTENKKGFVFYKSWADAAQYISDPAERVSFYEAIIDYAANGIEPSDLSAMAGMAFILVKPQIDANNSKSAGGRKGGRPEKPMVSACDEIEKPMVIDEHETKKPMVIDNCETEKPMVIENDETEKPSFKDKEKEKDKVKDKEKDKRGIVKGEAHSASMRELKHNKAFNPPTLDEVRRYCSERGSNVDPDKFFEYFDTGGWKDARGQPVRNWKQKLLTWEKFDKPMGKTAEYMPVQTQSPTESDVERMRRLMAKMEGDSGNA